jgi:antagonist of KipI
MTLTVLAGGLQTSVQDLGRFGYRHLGVGVSGALDGYSLRVANALVGNPPSSAALEITLAGPRLRFDRAARIAITGAEIDAHVEGAAIPGWRTIDLPQGCELFLGASRRGARAYLAVAGGIAVPMIMGSASTDVRGGFGGHEGRSLANGDRLRLGSSSVIQVATPEIASWWLDPETDLDFSRAPSIRILPGRDFLRADTAIDAGSFQVSPQSNRQGLRLQGPALSLVDTRERLSEPVAPGTIQLPPDGQPIVLLAEAQTIGGYPRIGHVIAADLPRLAQLRPGDTLRFESVDATEARALTCAQRQRLARIGLAIEQRRRDS